jgi:hypothetical protein
MEDDIKRILQDKQFHLQLKSEQKEIIQIVLERKDSMAVLPTGFGKSMKSDSHETWKCTDPELEWQIRCFPYGERSDVPRLQQVEQKAVGRQRNLGLHFIMPI